MCEIKIYVDGSFYKNMYGGGYVVFENDKLIYQDCGVGKNDIELLSMRNISGEMTAAMHATHWLYKNNKKGTIIHDYIGLSKWVTGEWKTNKIYTQKYKEYMFPHYNQGTIQFKWVRGHTNITGNEIADRLAKQSIIYNTQWSL